MVWRPRTEIGRKIKHFIRTGETQPPPRGTRRMLYGQREERYYNVQSITIDDESTVIFTDKDKFVLDRPYDVVIQCDVSVPIRIQHSGTETIIFGEGSTRMDVVRYPDHLRIMDVYIGSGGE